MSVTTDLRRDAIRALRRLSAEAVDALDEDVFGKPEDVAADIDPGDIAGAVIDLLEAMVAEELEERQAEILCPECGVLTEPTCERTGDPADERRECREHGLVL